MNSIINHLGESSPQKNKLTYKDYTLGGTYTSSWQSTDAVLVQAIDRLSVYAELLEATCTNTLVLDQSHYNRIFLSGLTSGYPTYPNVGMSITFDDSSAFPNTLTVKVRVYFHENNACVTSADNAYSVYGHVAYTIGYLSTENFTRI